MAKGIQSIAPKGQRITVYKQTPPGNVLHIDCGTSATGRTLRGGASAANLRDD